MEDNKYHIGLCMAGAVSAGAYTAGVMDFLIETLDKWEKAKGKDESIPRHQVQIDVIGGASAGGMTSIIGAIALQKKFQPVTKKPEGAATNNPFYDSWVKLTSKNMMQQMLHTSDLENATSVKSIFNSSFIDTIANQTISSFQPFEEKRKYISHNLDVFVTLSNLTGVPYNLRFRGNGASGENYKMASYRDIGHFSFCGEYNGNGRININGSENENMAILRQCAMATGAFPFGLQYREVHRHFKYLRDNKEWQKFAGSGDIDWEKLEAYCGNEKMYKTINADGGMMNNEPFEIVWHLLTDKNKMDEKSVRSYKKTNGSILMIDPFPAEDMLLKYENDFGMGTLASKLFGAMRGQLLFKEQEIVSAMDPENAGLFMIVPKRSAGKEKYEGAEAIACGALGGFSGFFDFNFREHDYFLGRYNCQKFLRNVYTIQNPLENDIFKDGYKHPAAQERYFFKDEKGIVHAPVIPETDYDRRENKVPEKYKLDWPQFNEEIRRELKPLFRKRYRAVFDKSIGGNMLNRILLGIGYQVVIGRLITNKTIKIIEDELRTHKLMKE
jgi:hypothetical protein